MTPTRTKIRCSVRCGRGSDMRCPTGEPLYDVLDELERAGWERHFNDVDAAAAASLLARCTNCESRGCFGYVGMSSENSYRAFWSCRRCGHWTEV